MAATRLEFVDRLLYALGVPNSRHNRVALLAWAQTEHAISDTSPEARFNCLNTTKKVNDSTPFGRNLGTDTAPFYVQNYKTLADGVQATLLTLLEPGHGYAAIRHHLKLSADPLSTAEAIGDSGWGTDADLLLRVVPDVQNNFQPYADRSVG